MTDTPVNYDCRPVSYDLHMGEDEKETMGARIKRGLEIKDLGQSELARVLGIDRQTVHAWVHDVSEPTPENLLAIAHVLFDDDVHYLVHGATREPEGGFPIAPRASAAPDNATSGIFRSPFKRRRKT